MIRLAAACCALLVGLVTLPAGAHPVHGPDLPVAGTFVLPAGAEASVADVPPGNITTPRYPWRFPRALVDRPDERTGAQVHVVYVVPGEFPDQKLDELGVLEDSIRSQNHWMRQQSGNTQQWRFDTYTFEWDDPDTFDVEQIPVNAVDVSYIKTSSTSGSLRVGGLESLLRSKGFDAANKRYLIYAAVNAGGVCGEAFWPALSSGASVDGKYSAVYLNSSAGCRAKEFATGPTTPLFTETIAMQEMIHNDAMVPIGAPNGCGPIGLPAHVCKPPLILTPQLDPDWTDVMFPFVGLPLNEKVLDADHLDYYRHPVPAPQRDLENSVYLESL